MRASQAIPRDHSPRPRPGGRSGCRLNQVLLAAISTGNAKKAPPNGGAARSPSSSSSTSSTIRPKERRPKERYTCQECCRVFSTKGNMMRHAQATHGRGGLKIYPCQTCGKEFKRKEDLVMHVRVHTGEKPYACGNKLCGRRFARISDLRSHERIHSADAKSFECKLCGKSFTRPYDLKKHHMNIHQQGSSPKRRKSNTGRPDAAAPSSRGGAAGNHITGNGRSPKRRRDSAEMIDLGIKRAPNNSRKCWLQMEAGAVHATEGRAALSVYQLLQHHPANPQQQQQQQWEHRNRRQQPIEKLVCHAQSHSPRIGQGSSSLSLPPASHPSPSHPPSQFSPPLPPLQPPSPPLQPPLQPPPPPLSVPHQRQPTPPLQPPPPPLSVPHQQQPLPPRHPPLAVKALEATHRQFRRKRVRCDAHKHCDSAAPTEEIAGSRDASETTAAVDRHRRPAAAAGLPRQNGDAGGQRETDRGDATRGAKAHVHGAACGHVAVLHENHVDFLVEGGQLECYVEREKTRGGWLSSTKQGDGVGEGGCGCDDEAAKTRTKADAAKDGGGGGGGGGVDSSGTSGTLTTHSHPVHWDGARPDQPRGRCEGSNHGPHCGHDVIHHNGHLDYVVNGRLLHPVHADTALGDGEGNGAGGGGGSGDAPVLLFEDHGSIRALDDDFVTFWSSLDVLSEKADEAVTSWCDMCFGDEGGM